MKSNGNAKFGNAVAEDDLSVYTAVTVLKVGDLVLDPTRV